MHKDFSEFKKFIRNKNTAVIGIGISNTPLIYSLVKLGAKVTAFDKKTEKKLGKVANQLRDIGVSLELGDNYLENLSGFDVIFKTPSMRIDCDALVKSREEGAYITSEMEEFIRYCPAKIFGVTGSDGKTTTTTLIYNMLKDEGYQTWVGGNIGTPLFDKLDNIDKNDKVVLELSSFQLMTMDVSTDVAIVTNLSPNHLDIHKDMNEYINSKKNIFKYQNQNNMLILNKDNSITKSMINEAKGKVLEFSLKESINQGAYYKEGNLYLFEKVVCSLENIKLKGMHNVENLLAAFCAVSEDVSIKSMNNVATTFTGVEHRCEFVRELNNVKYYNDSIASSPTRTIAGLKAFEKPVILICGGYDKNIPFEPLAEQGFNKIKSLVIVGDTKFKIKKVFEDYMNKNNKAMDIFIVDTFKEAVYKAKEIAQHGDIVTLSPACASFDMFANFEIRGNEFKKIVNNMN